MASLGEEALALVMPGLASGLCRRLRPMVSPRDDECERIGLLELSLIMIPKHKLFWAGLAAGVSRVHHMAFR